jgi:hypothetical protein
MAENRIQRELETRELGQRPAAWTPPQSLPDPKPQPGWVFRYIRVSLMGVMDPTNVSANFREGWEPCKASDHPELQHHADPHSTSRFKDNIEIGGLLLCKAREEMVKQRRDYYKNLAESQIKAVDNNFLNAQDKRSNMTLFSDRKTEVTFGRGSKS